MRNMLLFLVAVLLINPLWGQSPDKTAKYWIVFKDKGIDNQIVNLVSSQTLKNRQLLALPTYQNSDLPLAENYIEDIKSLNISILHKSKWLNAVSAYLTENQVAEVKNLSFVSELIFIGANYTKSSSYSPLSQAKQAIKNVKTLPNNAFDQMQGDCFRQAGLTGRDVMIGIVDVGFAEADKSEKLSHIFKNNQVLGGQDFIQPKNKKLFKSFTSQDWHGREVWQMIAGIDPKNQQNIGFAPNARFYLARTDHGTLETRSEEDNWVAAIEWLDSLGVRLVNTSLGYAHHFTNPKENYHPFQMNGQTTLISKFTRIATLEKGMILVVSAGNEGDNPTWQVVTAPADSPYVIAVGASQSKCRAKMYYSSIGPDFLNYVKPDLSCYADMGTSFAAPMITGMIACLLEKKPQLSPQEIKTILSKSAHLAQSPNNYIGYGVPQAQFVLKLLNNLEAKIPTIETVEVEENEYTISVSYKEMDWIVVFHKKGDFTVLSQEKIKASPHLLIRKIPDCTHSTIDLGEKIVEVVWKK